MKNWNPTEPVRKEETGLTVAEEMELEQEVAEKKKPEQDDPVKKKFSLNKSEKQKRVEAWDDWIKNLYFDRCEKTASREVLADLGKRYFLAVLQELHLPEYIDRTYRDPINRDKSYAFVYMETYNPFLPKRNPNAEDPDEERRTYINSIIERRSHDCLTQFLLYGAVKLILKRENAKELKILQIERGSRVDLSDGFGKDKGDNEELDRIMQQDNPADSTDTPSQMDLNVAEKEAKLFFNGLNEDRRIACWAYVNKIPMNNPIVLSKLREEMKQSKFYTLLAKAYEKYEKTLPQDITKDGMDFAFREKFGETLHRCCDKWEKKSPEGSFLKQALKDGKIQQIGETNRARRAGLRPRTISVEKKDPVAGGIMTDSEKKCKKSIQPRGKNDSEAV